MQLSALSTAKVNLFLDVLNKRNDGYHNIGTLFQEVNISDELTIDLQESSTIILNTNINITVTPEKNLVYRAAKLLQEKYGVNKGAKIHLHKNLPMGAGMGAGSANAAITLKLLNELWELSLSPQELEQDGASLGADVPFFIQGKSALAEGIGEKLSIINIQLPYHILIYTPDLHINTAHAYSSLKPSGENRYAEFKQNLDSDVEFDSSLLFNKFEETIIPAFPIIQKIKDHMMDHGAANALLSGSGSSVFGLFKNENDAERAMDAECFSLKFKKLTNFLI